MQLRHRVGGHYTRLQLPFEIYLRVGWFLDINTLRALCSVSCATHAAICTILFHTVRLTDRDARHRLNCLLSRFEAGCTDYKTRSPVYAIRSLSYVSRSSLVFDKDVIPSLCSVLKRAWGLQFLHIDIRIASVPTMSAALAQAGVIRSSPCPVLTMWHMEQGQHDRCNRAVPFMGGVQVMSLGLLRGMTAFRFLRAIVLDDEICGLELCDFLRECGPDGPLKLLQSFSCCANVETVLYILCDLHACAPVLEHLALQVSARVVFPLTLSLHLVTVGIVVFVRYR